MLFEIGVILLLVLVNGLFSGAEIALVGIDRMRVRQLVEERRRGASAIEGLRANPERFFATVQIVITVVGAAAGAFGGATLARDAQPLFAPLAGRYADEVAFAVVVGAIAYLTLVLGELVPKSLALRYAERYALVVAPLLAGFATAARPLVWLLTRSSNLVLGLFGDKTTFTESRLSPAELRDLVDEATEAGSLDERVGEIASRAFAFGDLTAADAMIPRTRVVGIPRNASIEQLRSIVLEHQHSRLPVYIDSLDEIVGYVFYKDLLALAWEGQLIVLEDLIRLPYFVAGGMPAAAVLQEMRKRRVQLAIVLDEHGGTAGVITLDDLVEELIGEVVGEIQPAIAPWVRRDAEGSIVARGEVPVRELNREFDLTLPEGATFTTVGGLCMSLAGAVPQAGAVLQASDGIKIRIEQASQRAVELVRIFPQVSGDPSA